MQKIKKRKTPQNVGFFLAGIGRIKKSAGYNWGDEVGGISQSEIQVLLLRNAVHKVSYR
mgnify:CR=1 FL=1